MNRLHILFLVFLLSYFALETTGFRSLAGSPQTKGAGQQRALFDLFESQLPSHQRQRRSDALSVDFTVAGLSGVTNKVTVTLTNINHTFSGRHDILLVGPTGQKQFSVRRRRHVDLVNVTLTLDAQRLHCSRWCQIVSGTFSLRTRAGGYISSPRSCRAIPCSVVSLTEPIRTERGLVCGG